MEPRALELVRPTDAQLTTDSTPTFAWRDFDTITYEVQWDTEPEFSAPESAGETNLLSCTPAETHDVGVYYWRARAKDDSNFRWSEWSQPSSFIVEKEHEHPAAWRQRVGAQFMRNELGGTGVSGEQVVSTVSGSVSGSGAIQFSGRTATLTRSASPARAGATGRLVVSAHGDSDSGCGSHECASVTIDGRTTDARRSFTQEDVFLFAFQDLVIDLTQMPTAPGEPWRGTIYELRIDPVIDYLDATMMPAAGFFEIDRITLV